METTTGLKVKVESEWWMAPARADWTPPQVVAKLQALGLNVIRINYATNQYLVNKTKEEKELGWLPLS